MTRITNGHVGVFFLASALAMEALSGCGTTSSPSPMQGAGGSGQDVAGTMPPPGGAAGSTGGQSAGGSSGSGGGVDTGGHGGVNGGAGGAAPTSVTATGAANLRTAVNVLFAEQISYLAKVTGAVLAGRTDEAAAYLAILNTNSSELGAAFGQALGASAESKFNEIWNAHTGYFVDYTNALVSTSSDASTQQAMALASLNQQFVPTFSAFVSDSTGLELAGLTGLVTTHVSLTKTLIDDQNAARVAVAPEAWSKVYADLRTSTAHMTRIADPVSEAAALRKPLVFSGDSMAKGVTLRVTLDLSLTESLFLLTSASDAALGGRDAEQGAAADALRANASALSALFASSGGADVAKSFESSWGAHNVAFLDYAQAASKHTAAGDASKALALSTLTNMVVPQLRDVFTSLTNLQPATLTALLNDEVAATQAAIDAQDKAVAADKGASAAAAATAAAADDTAALERETLGDPLAASIVAKNATQP